MFNFSGTNAFVIGICERPIIDLGGRFKWEIMKYDKKGNRRWRNCRKAQYLCKTIKIQFDVSPIGNVYMRKPQLGEE